jgi:putative ABC transport system permease protein
MFKNYISTAIRSLLRYKGYSAINLSGLVLGITACILSCLYVQYELSYDEFHGASEQIYRIQNSFVPPAGDNAYPHVVSALAPALASSNDDVLSFVRLTKAAGGGFNNSLIIRIEDDFFKEEDVFAADPNFFEFFDFDLLEGNTADVLDQPYEVVLSQKAAERYFGTTQVVGRGLRFTNNPEKEYIISGVMRNLPANTHLKAEILLSMATLDALNPDVEQTINEAWLNDGFYTYLQMAPEASLPEVERHMQRLAEQHVNQQELPRFNAQLMPLTDIHLHSQVLNEIKVNGSMEQLVIFISVVAFILALAIINYMNLATARSARRAREVGMRKTLGATRRQLIIQFIGESMVLSLLATCISLLLAMLLLPYFNEITNTELVLEIHRNGTLLLLLAAVCFLVGILSGSYPAVFLSSFKPSEVLKGRLTAGMRSTPLLRSGLVVFQFTVAVILISCTWVVYDQLNFLRNKDLGYQKDNILVLKNPDNILTPRLNEFKRELMLNPNIINAAASFSSPGGLRPIIGMKTPDMNEEEKVNLALINVDFEYIPTLAIALVQGRNFDPQLSTDSTEAVILNRRAALELGLGDNPVGKPILVDNFNGEFIEKRVIGLIDNINFEPLYRNTEAAYLSYKFPFFNYIFVNLQGENRQESISHIEETWKTFVQDQPLEYSFLDDNLNQLYQAEQQMGTLVTVFAVLAVFVALLGLFGLASFATDQRRKEIGLRKVLGAKVSSIILLFFKEYIKIIAIANLIGWPAAWWLASRWMENFTFHVSFNPLILLISGLLILLIALLTVGAKAYAAALINPIRAIRND